MPASMQDMLNANVAPGKKYDAGKQRWDLVPLLAMSEVVNVLTHGAQKYGDWNWTRVSEPENRYYAACQRHLVAWAIDDAPSIDADSKCNHLAHAICCLMFLLEMELDPSTKNTL